ncbi:MAG: imidazole glycerol phosphate synthase subunit HisH [Acidimicrobiaceae bacterium]|nr:imidazole glycerol phosphate synthase subunit HisH [Acidimicrobiaceae bacterium]
MSEPTIAILDYGIGNLHSAHKGFAHAGANAVLTRDPAVIAAADGVVLPGVGAFGPCVEAIRSVGLDKVTHERIAAGVPFFGICVGMQVLFSGSDESPGVDGLGVFDERIIALPDTVKRPQMQWNMIDRTVVDHPMFEGLADDVWVYFVHSYAAELGPDVVATCAYGDDLVAAVGRDHVWACQFHPEKSGRNGLRILENFVAAAREA